MGATKNARSPATPGQPPAQQRRQGQIVARGDHTFLLRVYVGRAGDGSGTRRYVNSTFHGTAKDARSELTRLLRANDTQTLVTPTQQTLNSYIEEWLESKQRVSARTVRSYRTTLDTYILPTLGKIKLTSLTPTLIQQTYNGLREQGLSPRTIEYGHVVLHQALKKACKLGLLVKNPTEDTERPTKGRREFTILSPQQMVKLLETECGKPLYPLWLLLLNTGLRPGEALALRWADLEGETIHVRRVLVMVADGSYEIGPENTAKTRDSLRSVTVSATVLTALKEHRQRQVSQMLAYGEHYKRADLIFTQKLGEHCDLSNIRARWKSALKRAGLPADVRLYDTRHSHATALLNDGNVNLAWVSARLGHSSVKTTESAYTSVLPEAHRSMADTMETILKEAERRAARKE